MLKIKIPGKILFGIDANNVAKLKQGMPIKIKGEELDLDVDIYIAYGDTLDDIIKELGITFSEKEG